MWEGRQECSPLLTTLRDCTVDHAVWQQVSIFCPDSLTSPPRPRPCALYRAGEHGASVLQCLEEQDRKCRMFLMVEERSPRVSPGGEGRDNIRKMAKKVVQVFTTIKVCVYLHVHVCSCLLALARHNPGALQAGVCLSARLVCLPLTTCPALPCLALSLVAGECGGRR